MADAPPPLDRLLAQERLFFTRPGGFDLDALAAAIAGLGFSFRAETDPAWVVIAVDAASRDQFQARRRETPPGPFPYSPLLHATAERIEFRPKAGAEDERDISAAVIAYLTALEGCTVADESGAPIPATPPARAKPARGTRPGV